MHTESLEDIFGAPISVYTDEQAVADGVLVNVRGLLPVAWKITRVTRALWDAYTTTIGGVMTNVTAIVRELRTAWTGAREERGWRIGQTSDGRTVWFVPNEVGGITAMFPEDY